jgi:hypothetical protein
MEASLSRRGAGIGHGLSRYSKHTDQIQSARTGYVRASPRADPDVFAQSAKTTEVFALAIGGRQVFLREAKNTESLLQPSRAQAPGVSRLCRCKT